MRKAIGLFCCIVLLSSFSAFFAHGADEYVYPEPEVLQIDLVMHPSRYLRMIRSDEKQKQEAVVCMDEGEPQTIGVQVRGRSSLREGMESASKRIPMELCFDYADPDGTFRGNPSLKLINCLTPARLVTQLVAMQAFAFLDVPAPRTTPAFIRINDTDFGLYLAVEDLNEAFMQNNFGGGSLYRPVSERDDPDSRMSDLFEWIDMVAKVDAGHDTIRRYTQARSCGADAEAFLDVDECLRYMACEAFVTNDDCFITNNHNFYVADDHGKLKLTVWDQDCVFTAFSEGTSLKKIEYWAEKNNRCYQYLMQNEAYFARFRQYVRQLNDEFLDPDMFLPWLENYIRVLAPYFRRDPTIQMRSDDPFADLTTGNKLYNTLSGNLLLTFRTYHDQLGAQLSGEADGFSIPQGMTIESGELRTDEEVQALRTDDRSVIFRVCAGYWRLRRQTILQNDGKALAAIGAFFALVFAATVFCVYRPAHKKRCRRKD